MKNMETAVQYFIKQMTQQLSMWKKAPKEVIGDKDVLDKMCKTHIDASLMSAAYSLALIADSLVEISEQQRNQNDKSKTEKSN